MNKPRIQPDDPKLTAYALGELSGDERAAVEAALRKNPALRLAVDEIRATAAQLESALAGEAIFRPPAPTAANAGIVIELNGHAARSALAREAAARAEADGTPRPVPMKPEHGYELARSRPNLLRFPQCYYVIASAAAACFALLLALREPRPPAATPVENPIRDDSVRRPASTPADEPRRNFVNLAPSPEAQGVTMEIPPVPGTTVEPPVMTADIDPTKTTASGAAFIEGDLSLIGQARQGGPAQEHPSQVVARGPFPEAARASQDVVTTSDPGAAGREREAPASRIVTASATDATAETKIEFSAAGPAAPLFHADALTPPVAIPGSTVPSLVPNTVPSTRRSGGSLTPTNSGDIIVLSAFTVTADRAIGFATESDTRPGAPRGDERARHDYRPLPPPGAQFGRNAESYSYIRDNDFLSVAQNPLSTFSIDVDSASYANVRRILEYGSPPPRDAVRIEELLNYFPYRYAPPRGDAPFAATMETADAPWAPGHRIVRIGLKAREISTAERPAASLVFLLDVSGSMNQPNKLPLVKQALRLLVGKLKPDDRVAIVTYAGNSGLALASTPVARSRVILNALDALAPGGSTNGAMGIQLAYDLAQANFVRDGINRVILCTDGDFNVGPASEGELVRLISEKTASGVFLTVLGFGMGNLKDATLEKLADHGNGNYGYIDTRREAEKLLVEQVNGTLVTVAKDVKIQVEFNPATVSQYRLIGYENRLLRKEDFNDDATDAGEIGAGHAVTALYEIVPVGAADEDKDRPPPVDALKYATPESLRPRAAPAFGRRDPLNDELLTVKVRYKKPDSLFSFPKTLEFPLANATTAFAEASADLRFAAAVAQFGMILRGSPHRGTATMGEVAAWAAAASTPAEDPGGYRREFIELVRKAQAMIE